MHWFLEMLIFGGERRVPPAAIPSTWRRIFHITAGSSIPLAGIFVSESAMVWALALVASGGLILDLVRFRIGWLNSIFTRLLAPLLKHDEGAHITGATYMVIAALLVFVLYGKEVAIPVMFFLSLGDPAAALVGKGMPGPRIFGKTPIGTAAFIVVAAAALAVLISADGIEPHWALWVGAGIAGVVELATLPPDDNLTIPLVAGAAMFAMGI
jgi:dolichol kinase